MNAYENYRLFTISLIIPRILCKFAIPKYIIEYGTSIEYLQHAYEKEEAIHTPARAACRYVRMWPHGLW